MSGETMSYQPLFDITDDMLNKIVEITEIVTKLTLTQPQNFHLRKENRLRSIHSSLAIESNSLSLEQVTAIVNGKRVLGKPLEIREVQNAYQAYELIFKLNPYQVTDLLQAHGYLMADLVKRLGGFRLGDVSIYDIAGNLVHMGARPQFVSHLVNELLEWGQSSVIPALIKSSVVHYELEKIHPFEDGNGRMGRLWQNLILAQDYPIFEYLPIETMIYEHQESYYKALSDNKSATRFINFMLDIIMETIKNSDITSDKIAIKQLSKPQTEFYHLIRDYLQKNESVTSAEAQILSGKSAATVRNYFAKLVSKNLLVAQGENKARKYFLAN